jgi:dihydrolipoamide dehydrogenase
MYCMRSLTSITGESETECEGRYAGPNEVKVNLTEGGEQTISTKNIMIATGSNYSSVPGLDVDEKK